MKKKIKKIGKAIAISFTKDEQEMYGLKIGDIINLDDDSLEIKKNVATIIKGIKK